MFKQFDTPVRCSAGHLFTTIWIPLASVKSVRRGLTRFQYCPVGHHWATVTPLDVEEAAPTEKELAEAALVHDIPIP
jgi:hypothetical protein